jgi:CHASE2 domain-containing sensor protein
MFLVACGLAFALEKGIEAVFSGAGGDGAGRSALLARGIYERVVTSWPRSLVARSTAIVTIEPRGSDALVVSADNICEQRIFLAQLLRALAAQDPDAIVVDKYFSVSRCGPNEPGTITLRDSIREVSGRIPIVLGLRIQEDIPPQTVASRLAYSIETPIEFGDVPKLSEGIVNIDSDSRRLSLGWPIRRSDGADVHWQGSLALEAAKAYQPTLLDMYPVLRGLIAHGTSPYISLIAPGNFPRFSAGDVLCGFNALRPDYRAKCAGRPAPREAISRLRGRIVLVGELDKDRDWHESVVGPVFGLMLQANYVEALLDERYFRPVPLWLNYLTGFGVFVGFKAALERGAIWKCIVGVVAVLSATFLLVFLTARHLGYLLDPVDSLMVLALLLVYWGFEKFIHKKEQQS